MSFLSKALRRAEVFLEQVDESVAQANRRLVVEGVTDGVDDADGWVPTSDDPLAAGVLHEGESAESGDEHALPAPEAPFQRKSSAARFARNAREPRARESAAPSPPSFVGSSAVKDLKESIFPRVSPSRALPTPANDAQLPTDSASQPDEPVASENLDGWGDFDISDAEPSSEVHAGSESATGRPAAALSSGDTDHASGRQSAPLVPVPSGSDEAVIARLGTGATPDTGRMNKAGTADTEREGNEQAAGRSPSITVGESVRARSSPADEKSRTEEGDPSEDLHPGGEKTTHDSLGASVREPDQSSLAYQEQSSRVAPQNETSVPQSASTVENSPQTGASDTPQHQTSAGGVASSVVAENNELRKELELAEDDIENLVKERSKLVNNLRRLKDVVSEMDESLEEKSADARRLGDELSDVKHERTKLQKQLREAVATSKDTLDLERKQHKKEVEKLGTELAAARSEEARLRTENTNIKEALTQGREVDMATADDARLLATKAQTAYEEEAAAHRETREALKTKQEAMDTESTMAANAIAVAQRKADEAIAAAGVARSAQRDAENHLSRVTTARDAALARVQDLADELSVFKGGEDGSTPGAEELASLRQTAIELETALEAKNVELTRLEGEIENLRNVVHVQNEAGMSRGRSPGGAGVANEVANSHEVEQKLRHMADAALRKQAQLEVLRSENKALQHQIDTERKRTREAQAMAAVATSSRHTLRGGFRGILDVGDEERGSRSFVPREGPMARLRTPRNWPPAAARFLGSLDKLSAEALSFLRKEPLLRIVILIYACAMHVLVYGLLHFHIESTMGNDQVGGIHAHPHEPLVQPKP